MTKKTVETGLLLLAETHRVLLLRLSVNTVSAS